MTDNVELNELELLKQQATNLGLTYKANVTVKALKKMVADELAKEVLEENMAETKDKIMEATKLHRIIITPNDPLRKDWQGEIFTVGNDVVPTLKKFVPYGVEYHVPDILLKFIKSRVYQTFISRKSGKTEVKESRELPAYSVIELPQLTKEELEDLKSSQVARQALQED